MALCAYLYQDKNSTKKNIYKFGTIENNYMIKKTRGNNSKTILKKSNVIFHTFSDNILKKSNVIFHIFSDNITKIIEINIISIFKKIFILHKYLENEYFEGDYKHMINIIYSIINNDSNYLTYNNNINNNQTIKNLNDDIKTNYIYLLQEREFIALNKNIYKIGMSQLNNYGRFLQYPNNSILMFQMKCEDCIKLEKIIINNFKKNFLRKTDIGNEYFEGDCNKMIHYIYNLIMNENILTDSKEIKIKNELKLIQINKDTIKNQILKEYSISTQIIRENIKYNCIHDEMKMFGIDKESNKIFEKFMNIIKTDKDILKHNNLIKLLKNKTIFNNTIIIDDSEIKIALIRKIEKDNNISILNLNFNEADPVVMDDLTFYYLKKHFCSKKKKSLDKHYFKLFYISMLKHLCNELIFTKIENRIINGKRKIITKYHLNIERIKLSLELEKYSNPKIYEEIIYDGLLKILE